MAVSVIYFLAALGSWWLAFRATLKLGFMIGRRHETGDGDYAAAAVIAVVCTLLMVAFISALAER